MENVMYSKLMLSWIRDLFPINRSLSGDGVRETLDYIKSIIPGLAIHQIPSGTRVMDWVVPDEWNIKDAYITNEGGHRIIDFKKNNLHVLGYSTPVNLWMSREELDKYLYSLPEQEDAIPYVTSYYKARWGFCLTHKQRLAMDSGMYHVVIESEVKSGHLNYAELIISGETEEEIFLSTYICHPSMANNELSGPSVMMALALWLESLKKRRYTYRIVFIPETIGSIIYLSKNIAHLKKRVIAGFNVTCVGDDRCYSFLPSRSQDTLSDKVALHVLSNTDPEFKRYSWLDRGSDERQYCAPGVDLPIASIMRSKYGEYPEYHTSLDNLSLVTEAGLYGSYLAISRSIEAIESNAYYKVIILGEPQLGRRELYPGISKKNSGESVRVMMDLISYCDGNNSLLEIANLIKKPIWTLTGLAEELVDRDILQKKYKPF